MKVHVTSDVLRIDQKLKEIDPQLFIIFDGTAEKFEVWRECPDGRKRILVVEDENGNPMPLDDRVVHRILLADTHTRGLETIIKEIDEKNQKVLDEQKKKFDEFIEEELAPRLIYAIKKDRGY